MKLKQLTLSIATAALLGLGFGAVSAAVVVNAVPATTLTSSSSATSSSLLSTDGSVDPDHVHGTDGCKIHGWPDKRVQNCICRRTYGERCKATNS